MSKRFVVKNLYSGHVEILKTALLERIERLRFMIKEAADNHRSIKYIEELSIALEITEEMAKGLKVEEEDHVQGEK